MTIINPQASQYFQTLPKMVQESIMQSGVDFYTEEELAGFVAGLEWPLGH